MSYDKGTFLKLFNTLSFSLSLNDGSTAANIHSFTTSECENGITFSEESRFCLDVNDGRVRVRRLPGERFFDCCIKEHDRYGGGSVMVWGGITWTGKTELIRVEGNLTGQRYVDEIILPVAVPYLNRAGNQLTFQQDNARPHTAPASSIPMIRPLSKSVVCLRPTRFMVSEHMHAYR